MSCYSKISQRFNDMPPKMTPALISLLFFSMGPSASGLFFFRKKCFSSGTPGGNWKIAISSNFFRKKLEEMEDIGRIIFFSIGCSEYVVWNNQLEVFGLFLQNSRNWQTILWWQLEFCICIPWHIIWWGTASSPASISGACKTAHDKQLPWFCHPSIKVSEGTSCMSYTLTLFKYCERNIQKCKSGNCYQSEYFCIRKFAYT